MKTSFEIDISSESIKETKNKLKEILREESLFEGDFLLASGKRSNYYLDTRLTSLSPKGLYLISVLIWDIISKKDTQIHGVAGPSIGADPIISGVSFFSQIMGNPLKAGLIRKENKAHGTAKLVEGPIKRGENVVLLEDVVTSGGSSLKALYALREHGCKVDELICLVLRDENGKALLENEGGIKVTALFTAEELLKK
jgi:orotate phosphoribosyltransferase